MTLSRPLYKCVQTCNEGDPRMLVLRTLIQQKVTWKIAVIHYSQVLTFLFPVLYKCQHYAYPVTKLNYKINHIKYFFLPRLILTTPLKTPMLLQHIASVPIAITCQEIHEISMKVTRKKYENSHCIYTSSRKKNTYQQEMIQRRRKKN